MNSKMKTRLKIIGATATAVFSLASVFTGTYAWFASNNTVTASGATIQVVAPEQLEYDIYYLSSFTDENSATKPGNYNAATGLFSGYQTAYENAAFTQISFSEGQVTNSPNPLNISALWPAHKLTFAFVITQSAMSKLTITDWGEGEGNEAANAAKVNVSQYVRLSWAIDIYGEAYNVTSTGNVLNDISTGYASYFADNQVTDVFNYSESELANLPPNAKDPIDVVDSVEENEAGEITIVYFSIEFSNDTSTFYKFNESTGYYDHYVSGDTTGFNSNCYEGLSLTSLVFSIQ